jgi:predicted dehydrogenase
MYLYANDKATGVANFQSAVGSKPIRGELVAKSLKQGLAPRKGLEPLHFQYAAKLDHPLAAGLLGAGRQGLRLLAAVNPAYVAVKALADLRPSNRTRALKAAKGAHDYESYGKLLAAAKSDGLEAVIIALPSHLHAPAALAALEAGLHVFVEPPMALSVADAKRVARKAAEKNLILAVGQQRRYNWIYDHALEMVRLNLLNDVHYFRSQWHVPKSEKKPDDAKAKTAAAGKEPGELKIDWWQEVPKEEADLTFDGYDRPLELVRWQLYEKYSGGLLAELGSQLFDAAAMFVAAMSNRDPRRPYPLSVAGSGSQTLRGVEGDIDDHVHCIFEYAIQGYVEDKAILPKARKKIALQFDIIIGNEFDGYGETILGRQGSLVLESERKAMLFSTSDVNKNLRVIEKKAGTDKDAKSVPAIDVPKDGKADEESQARGLLALQGADAGFATELEHWAFCCKPPADGKASFDAKPRCDAEKGLYATVLTVAAARAVKTGKRVDFKEEWFKVASDETPDLTSDELTDIHLSPVFA